MKGSGSRKLVWAVPAVALAALAAGAAFKLFVMNLMGEAITVDFPWLLEAGRTIVANRALPEADMFSWTHPDAPWILYQWLFEVLLALGVDGVGLDATVRLFLVAVAAIYLLVPLFGGVPRRVPLVLTGLVGSLGLIVLTVNVSIRPMVVTALFLLLQYLAVAALRRGTIRLWQCAAILAPTYLLWGNMHLGVILGIVSLLLMLVGDAVEWKGYRRFEPADPEIEGRPLGPRSYAVLIGLALAASMLNPYGPYIYERIIDLSAQADHTDSVHELQPLNLRWPQGQILMAMFAVFLLAMLRARRTLSMQEILHIAVFTVMALTAVRLIVWTVLFYVLILPKAAHHGLAVAGGGRSVLRRLVHAPERYRALLQGMYVAVSVATLLVFPRAIEPLTMGDCEAFLPSLETLAAERRPGDRLINDARTGSCLLLVDPDARLFIDSRFEFYGGAFTAQVKAFFEAAPGWQNFVRQWDVNLAAFAKSWPLDRVLAESPGWRQVHDDGVLVIYRKGK